MLMVFGFRSRQRRKTWTKFSMVLGSASVRPGGSGDVSADTGKHDLDGCQRFQPAWVLIMSLALSDRNIETKLESRG